MTDFRFVSGELVEDWLAHNFRNAREISISKINIYSTSEKKEEELCMYSLNEAASYSEERSPMSQMTPGMQIKNILNICHHQFSSLASTFLHMSNLF